MVRFNTGLERHGTTNFSLTGEWFKKKLDKSLELIKIVSEFVEDETWHTRQLEQLVKNFRFRTSKHGRWLAELANASTDMQPANT